MPPNVRFEIEDATLPWTFPESTFDFIHMRYLFGSVGDWSALFREAFSACAPGGWVESLEVEVDYVSDDGTVKPDSAMAMWGRMCREAGPKMGRPFTILRDRLQRKGMEEAGFTNIHEVDRKVPMGGWPLDPKLAEVGRFVQLGFENDLEGEQASYPQRDAYDGRIALMTHDRIFNTRVEYDTGLAGGRVPRIPDKYAKGTAGSKHPSLLLDTDFIWAKACLGRRGAGNS